MSTRLFAMCNMMFNGRGFCVVQKPDYNGGHYHEIEPYNYETKNFEYISWCGTPKEYAEQQPTFTIHVEPFHGKPYDGEYTATEMVEIYLNR